MSRETKIKDTERILSGFDYDKDFQLFYNGGGTEGCIPLSRDAIKHYADEACLEACQLLYDLNIQTFYSGANVDNKENSNSEAFIGISYDTLSEENKEVVRMMIERGIIDGIHNDDGRGEGNIITISIPINSEDLVGAVSDKLMAIVSQFVQQDVLYGRTTIDKIRSLYYQKENGNYFDYLTWGELTPQELEVRMAEEVLAYYADEEGNLFYTGDLLNKHLAYKLNNLKKR